MTNRLTWTHRAAALTLMTVLQLAPVFAKTAGLGTADAHLAAPQTGVTEPTSIVLAGSALLAISVIARRRRSS